MSEIVKRDRDEKGRFMKGWKGGPGRLPMVREQKYLTTLQDAIEMDEWVKICKTAVADAGEGDWRAREWLSKYLLPSVQVLRAQKEEEYDPDIDKKITTYIAVIEQLIGPSDT